jgi:hypothetical protein
MSGLLDTDDVNVRVARHRRTACLGYATQAKCMFGLLDTGEVHVWDTTQAKCMFGLLDTGEVHVWDTRHRRSACPGYSTSMM